MENQFKECTLGDIANFRNGKGLSNLSYSPYGKYPVFGSNGQIAYTNELLNKTPVIVVGRVGAYCGSVYRINQASWVTDNAIIAEPKPNTNFGYLYYRLKSLNLNQTAIGSAQPLVTQGGLKVIKTLLPPLAEQKAIAHILGTLDDKIELNQRMNRTLEAIARAIFKSWFIDFDPVRAKMEGRQPEGMSKEVADLFCDSFVDSQLGMIPKGWEVSTIGESVKVVGGSTPSTKNPDYWEGGNICWTTPKDLSTLQVPVLLDTDRKITELGLLQISSGLLPAKTLLLSSRAPIGYLAITEIPVAINQGYIAMICNQKLSIHYVKHWVSNNMDTIIGRANGTTFLEISKSNFRPIEIIIPNSQILEAFTTQSELLYKKAVNNLYKTRYLTNIRDSLLPRLISGEIRIKETEKIIEKEI